MRQTVRVLSSVCQRLVQVGYCPRERARTPAGGSRSSRASSASPEATLARVGAALRAARSPSARRADSGSTRAPTSAASARCRRTWRAASRPPRRPRSRSPKSAVEIVRARPPGGARRGAAARRRGVRRDALRRAARRRRSRSGQLAAIRDVVLPALVEIGARWESADITVGHEHFASHLIERRLLGLAQGLGGRPRAARAARVPVGRAPHARARLLRAAARRARLADRLPRRRHAGRAGHRLQRVDGARRRGPVRARPRCT